ncbi:serine/threonine protein kinase [Xenococcus sp. PCC 7305]|uniref:serine/threonine-protein kinase n=1 Tax=Xenococcus sp. PCC 7305 TaxID=102125 RepID=UPI0002AC8247|nr:serine/threonine-protein kinase [Xenococcus sp. PCC 7305]ELS02028.1 serine/threonine protein kinase [Xenococcus sp. PCC 7305]
MSESSYLVNQEQIPFGTIINNRYLIQKVLGQGGLGRTYLAFDTHRFNEACVLKEFAPLGSGKYELEKSRDLFKREAKILHHIRHPQIPKFLACFEGHGRLFLVQEFVSGKTYSALLQERQRQQMAFGEMEIVKWLMNLLPILEYIHNLGIIHRDISPDNIMQPDGKDLPVLIDFGVGKLTNTPPSEYGQAGAQGHSYVGKMSFVGKIGYAPREQISMGRCSPSSDIYALGVTALVMLTGKEPTALLDQYSLEWQWHKFIEVSPQLTTVLGQMTAERPLERYQSAQETLEHIQYNYPVNQYPSLAKTVPYQPDFVKPVLTEEEDDDTVIVPHSVASTSPSVVNPGNSQPSPQPKSNVREVENTTETMQETMIVSDDNRARTSQPVARAQNPQPLQSSAPPRYTSQISRPSSVNRIDLDFIKRCEQELAYCIGPMAGLIVEEILEQQPSSNHELMEALAQQIPDVKKAMEFRQKLAGN